MKHLVRVIAALAICVGVLVGTTGAASADHWPVKPGPCFGNPSQVIEIPDDGDPLVRICVY